MHLFKDYPRNSVAVVISSAYLLCTGVICGCFSNAHKDLNTIKESNIPIVRVKIYDSEKPPTVSCKECSIRRGEERYRQPFLNGILQIRPEENRVYLSEDLFIGPSEWIEIIPEDNLFKINEVSYRGHFRIYYIEGNIVIVNYIDVESYLKGVLRAELPRNFHREAYRAQAIASRTYVLYEKLTSAASARWDVVATEKSQVYSGADVETKKSIEAVEATRGIVLVAKTPAGWRIFPSFFSSCCGGLTQPASNISNVKNSIEPLAGGVRCNWCRISPYYRWQAREVPFVYIKTVLNKRYFRKDIIESIDKIEVEETDLGGRISRVRIIYNRNKTLSITAEHFRIMLGNKFMPSTLCKLKTEGQKLILYDGRGLGHGVGMCQWGAEGMARAGYTALEILSFYYPGARAVRAY